jgi:hypothetical protein
MTLKASVIERIRGPYWSTEFNSEDVYGVFDSVGPMNSIFYSTIFSLAWFVEKVCKNKQGKPLKLQPFQMVLLDGLWTKKFPMMLASRGAGKTFILALYCILRAMLMPGSKIVIVGAGFRQAKLVFKYIEELYNASPLIQEAVGAGERPKYGSDAATLQVGLSSITAIPIGDGDKIRGLRATILIADEFAAIPEEIFDIVIAPFTAVHANPAERAEIMKFIRKLQELGTSEHIVNLIRKTQGFGNQIILSGTPSHKQNHFYKRYCVYKMFIESSGDPQKIKRALEERALHTTGRVDTIDKKDVESMSRIWDQYVIYQVPYNGLPEGFLDEDQIRSDRAAFPKYRFEMEYEAKFPDDSHGFIRRSWIERATPHTNVSGFSVPVELYGDPRATYVMGIDPARHNDNIAIVVLKLTDHGKEFVFCDAWEKTQFHVTANKIREVCRRFNVQYIAMDQGGGGDAVYEWLCKKQDGVEDNELIWVIPDQIEKFGQKSDLAAPGRKILEIVNFTAWSSSAAHALAAAIEQCNLLFPYKAFSDEAFNQYMRHFSVDHISESIKIKLQEDLWGVDDWEAELINGKPKLGVMQHIDECINETCAIVREVSPKGAESFELPSLSEQPEGLDMRRRDRWSALMLANYAAKVYQGHGHKITAGMPGGMRPGKRDASGIQRKGNSMWFNPKRYQP